MAYTAVPTYVTGDTFTAANANTYWRDNFAAGVPDIFTAAGDIAYATAANAAAPLAKGAAYQVLAMNSGATAPGWAHLGAVATIFSTAQGLESTTSTSYVTPSTSGGTLAITVQTTSTIVSFTSVNASITGGNRAQYLTTITDATDESNMGFLEGTTGAYYSGLTLMRVDTGIAAGTTNLKIYYLSQDGVTITNRWQHVAMVIPTT